ncbi:Vacuolar protein-sorting-associated protein 33 [Lithohypha guttulata]|uniref:Vacuolar protein-sorting-associated protein 33 n=1 Tax=Lithohypha guttulata TaxID=1690604 RepID=A0AAN7T4C6_9EURO|nr:Vacuolar protein-sorting-associated protein 33 [Lithohypha guttulata]
MAPHIDREAEHIKGKARKDLLALLENVRGKKNVVFSRDLPAIVGLFVGFSVLKEYGVEKVFVLENGNTDASQRNVVYIADGENPTKVQAVAAQIKQLQRNGNVEHEVTIIWVPRRTLVSNKILEDEGILGDVNIQELQIFFLPLEADLLSLEQSNGFHDLYLYGNRGPIHLASRALMQIQQRHGLFPRILGKGDNARKLANLLVRARKELDADEASTPYTTMPSTSIDSLIVIDRDVDMATPLLTQLTYEGLIDEMIGIKHNKAEVDSSIIGPGGQNWPSAGATAQPVTAPSRQALKQTIALDSSDTLYEQLRSVNFALIGPHLNKIARRLQTDLEGRHQAHEINELREFVNKLPVYKEEHKSLAVHTNMADDMTKYTRSETFNRELEIQQNIAAGTDPIYQHDTIEELISRDVSISTILRLLCLESTIAGGLRAKDLDNFKRQIVQAYGYQHLLTLDRLEKMELLQSRASASALLLPVGGGGASATGTQSNYGFLRKELHMIVDEYNEQDPDDVSYVYSGYAPLSIRLVQCILQKSYMQSLHKSPLPLTPSSTGWAGFEDILKSAKGPTFNIVQKPSDEKASKAKTALAGNAGWKYVFVMFLGGITCAEVAALRFINRKLAESGQRKKIMICTTGMISGRGIMEGVIETKTLGSGIKTPPTT